MNRKYFVPYFLVGGRYLGSSERVLLTGSLSNKRSYLEIIHLTQDFSYSSDFILSSQSLEGKITSMEIFGSSHLGKSFIAISSHHNNNNNNQNNNSLSIYEIPSQDNNNFIQIHSTFNSNSNSNLNSNKTYEDSIITNITSHITNNQLTTCTEFGDVIIHDLGGNEITRFNADYCGLETIKYSNSGLLITLGLSSGGQLSLWDTRTSSHSPSLSRSLRPPSSISSFSSSSSSLASTTSSSSLTSTSLTYPQFKNQHSYFNILGNFCVAVLSTNVASCVIHPIEVIQRRLSMDDQQPNERQRYKGMRDCFIKVYKDEGLRSFYRNLRLFTFSSNSNALKLFLFNQIYYKLNQIYEFNGSVDLK